jgi:hypothetical protein
LTSFESWNFTATKKGWTDDSVALKWLQEIFIPETKPPNGECRLLILDGHGNHTTIDFMWECYINNIYLLFLPPHSSHVLQPLDLAVFSPVKQRYRHYLARFIEAGDATPNGKMMFLWAYIKAREDALTSRNARAGFQASGLWPICMTKPMMHPMTIHTEEPRPTTPKQALEQAINTINTPQHIGDIRDLIYGCDPPPHSAARARLIIVKISRALDVYYHKLAAAELKIQQLEQQLELLKPKRKRKAIENPNDTFTRIKDIKRTRRELDSIITSPWVPPEVQTPVPLPHLPSSIPTIPK